MRLQGAWPSFSGEARNVVLCACKGCGCHFQVRPGFLFSAPEGPWLSFSGEARIVSLQITAQQRSGAVAVTFKCDQDCCNMCLLARAVDGISRSVQDCCTERFIAGTVVGNFRSGKDWLTVCLLAWDRGRHFQVRRPGLLYSAHEGLAHLAAGAARYLWARLQQFCWVTQNTAGHWENSRSLKEHSRSLGTHQVTRNSAGHSDQTAGHSEHSRSLGTNQAARSAPLQNASRANRL